MNAKSGSVQKTTNSSVTLQVFVIGSAFHLDKFRTTHRCSSTQRVSFYVSMPFLTVAAGGLLLLHHFGLFDIMSRSDSSVCLIHHCDDRTHMFVREYRQND